MLRWITKNKYIALASIFFISWKFFLIFTLWENRILPPEPDDSLVYVGYIYSVKECPSFICEYPYLSIKNPTGLTYLSYRLIFGGAAKIFSLDPTMVFHIGFYLGITAMLAVLILLLRNLTENKWLITLSIISLAAYNGSGAYHGFFWVVPSFFMTLLFFLLFSIVIKKMPLNWKYSIITAVVVPLFIFVHPISIYLVSIFVFYFIIHTIISKKVSIEMLKKIALIIILSTTIYGAQSVYLMSVSSKITNQVQQTISQALKSYRLNTDQSTPIALSDTTFKKSISTVSENYIRWIIPHWLMIIPFIFVIFILIHYKQYEIISIYFASSLFTFLSLFHAEGYRSLIILWPITYLLFSFGLWYLLVFLQEKISGKNLRDILKTTIILLAVFYWSFQMIYSYAWNKSMNLKKNFAIQDDFVEYLATRTKHDDLIRFESKTLHSYSIGTDLIEKSIFVKGANPKYFVTFNPSTVTIPKENDPLEELSNTISKVTGEKRNEIKKNEIMPILENYVLEKDFGDIKIYSRKTN